MDESTELLRRYARNGDQAAFAELVSRKAALVYSVALRQVCGDEHLAKDVTQRVFVDLARKAGKLEGHSTIDGWLYRAAFLTAAATVRSEQRRRKREQEAQAMGKVISDGSPDSDWMGARPALDRVINQLSEGERDAVLLRYYEGRSFAEIGQVLAISGDAARMRVDRALEKMRSALGRHGITSTTGALALALANQAAATVPSGLSAAVTGAALAGAASAGGTTMVAHVINFMTTTKIGLGIAGLVTVAAVCSAVYEGGAARQSKTALADTEASLVTARASLATAQKTHQADVAKQRQLAGAAAADDQKWDELQATVEKMREERAAELAARAALAAKAAKRRENAKAAELAAGQAFLAAYPQARDLLLGIGRAQIAHGYAAFFRAAGLTSDQIENLISQTDQQWIQTMTVGPRGFIPAETQLPDDQLKAILGDQGFQQFQSFQRMQQVEGVINEASSMSTEAPITGAQADQMAAILANASSSYQSGGKATLATIDWNQVIGQSQGILTEQQLAGIKYAEQWAQLNPLLVSFQKVGPPAK